MRCPKDGTALAAIDHHGVMVEECPRCGGLWLNKGELETIAKREKDSWLGRLVFGPRK
jgi:Zn-finger nucleic acid-binding protein